MTTGKATPSGLTVTVSYDHGCARLSPGSQSFGPLAATGQISVSAPASCAWAAAAGAEWITFTGASSGTGPGAVKYALPTNASAAPRSSFISISHQTFSVTQAAEPQAGSVSVTPASGTGVTQTFAFEFSDPTAWTNIASGEVLINGAEIHSRACYIHWDAAGKSLSLRDDGDTTWLGPVAIGGKASLSNSQCVLLPQTAKVTGAGASATLSLPIEFTNFFAPGVLTPDNVYMEEQSAATGVGWQQAGTWIVPFAFTPVSVSPVAGSGYSQVFTFKMDGVFPEDQVDLSFSTSIAFGTIQFYDHGCAMMITPAPPGIFQISLLGDLASSWIATDGAIGTGPALHNSQCSIDLAHSSAVLSGTTFTVQLPITFTAAFVGKKNIYVFGPGTGWPAGAPYTPLGNFTVTAPPHH